MIRRRFAGDFSTGTFICGELESPLTDPPPLNRRRQKYTIAELWDAMAATISFWDESIFLAEGEVPGSDALAYLIEAELQSEWETAVIFGSY